MNNKQKAQQILDYCLDYLGQSDDLENPYLKKSKIYKEMLKEIKFMLETD